MCGDNSKSNKNTYRCGHVPYLIEDGRQQPAHHTFDGSSRAKKHTLQHLCVFMLVILEIVAKLQQESCYTGNIQTQKVNAAYR